eukprot:4265683-Pyramimonas_sp.AAC.1
MAPPMRVLISTPEFPTTAHLPPHDRCVETHPFVKKRSSTVGETIISKPPSPVGESTSPVGELPSTVGELHRTAPTDRAAANQARRHSAATE